MKLLTRLDNFNFRWMIPIFERINKITGWDNRKLAHVFRRLSLLWAFISLSVNSVRHPTTGNLIINSLCVVYWAAFLNSYFKLTVNAICDAWERNGGDLLPREFHSQQPLRTFWSCWWYVVLLSEFIPPIVFPIGVFLASSIVFMYYCAANPMDKGKTIKERATDTAKNLTEFIRNLAPQPALQPITN